MCGRPGQTQSKDRLRNHVPPRDIMAFLFRLPSLTSPLFVSQPVTTCQGVIQRNVRGGGAILSEGRYLHKRCSRRRIIVILLTFEPSTSSFLLLPFWFSFPWGQLPPPPSDWVGGVQQVIVCDSSFRQMTVVRIQLFAD